MGARRWEDESAAVLQQRVLVGRTDELGLGGACGWKKTAGRRKRVELELSGGTQEVDFGEARKEVLRSCTLAADSRRSHR
jgi:hypothetical protein